MNPDLIGAAEAARLFEVHPTTVSRWVSSGRLTPTYKLPGRNGAYLFHRAEIEALASQRTEGA